jgi:hypothetical protein
VVSVGTGNLLQKLPTVHKRNLVNTYVWTSDGGQFAEMQETIEIQQQSSGSSYSSKAMDGAYPDLKFSAGDFGFKFELDALIGGHLDLTVALCRASASCLCWSKSRERLSSGRCSPLCSMSCCKG